MVEGIPPIRRRENGCFSAHTGRINKNGVPKEAQDNALSNNISGAVAAPSKPYALNNVEDASRVIFFLVGLGFGEESLFQRTILGGVQLATFVNQQEKVSFSLVWKDRWQAFSFRFATPR